MQVTIAYPIADGTILHFYGPPRARRLRWRRCKQHLQRHLERHVLGRQWGHYERGNSGGQLRKLQASCNLTTLGMMHPSANEHHNRHARKAEGSTTCMDSVCWREKLIQISPTWRAGGMAAGTQCCPDVRGYPVGLLRTRLQATRTALRL